MKFVTYLRWVLAYPIVVVGGVVMIAGLWIAGREVRECFAEVFTEQFGEG